MVTVGRPKRQRKVLGSSRMTSKGQVTIPAAVREKIGVKPGEKVDFEEDGGAIIVRRHFDLARFDAAIEKWRGTVDLGGMTVDEYIDDIRGH